MRSFKGEQGQLFFLWQCPHRLLNLTNSICKKKKKKICITQEVTGKTTNMPQPQNNNMVSKSQSRIGASGTLAQLSRPHYRFITNRNLVHVNYSVNGNY